MRTMMWLIALLSLLWTSGLIYVNEFMPIESKAVNEKEKKIDVNRSTISENINMMVVYFKSKLNGNDRRKISKVLEIGEKIYKINHIDILSIIAVESGFNKSVQNINTDGSIDYGLVQMNSQNIHEYYIKAGKILTLYDIDFERNDRYDVALNVMSAVIFLDEIRHNIRGNDNFYSQRQLIASYNTGVRGYFMAHNIDRVEKYFNRYSKYKELLLTMN